MNRYEVEDANRTHVPELEQTCWNQMPKAGWRELKLYRFDGTDLYQWFGRRGKDVNARDWSAFEDSATEIFRVISYDEQDDQRKLRSMVGLISLALDNSSDINDEEAALILKFLRRAAEKG